MSVSTIVIAELLGGIALLLWGVRMVRTGVVRGWGERLKLVLEQQLRTRIRAFSSGVFMTTILGSSTAMVLIVSGLVAAGTVGPATGLIIVLGADVGSALIAALLASGASHTALLAPLGLSIGYLIFSSASGFRTRALGRIFIGLGMLLLALRLIVGAAIPLQEAATFQIMLNALVSEPLLAFLVAALLTWLVHSSLAVLLMFSSLVLTGTLDAAQALPFLLGLNLGAGLPAISATLDQPPSARRVPLANLGCRASVAVFGLFFIDQLRAFVGNVDVDPMIVLAALHLSFNLITAIMFVPFAPLLIRGTQTLLPDVETGDSDLPKPRHLSADAVISPQHALSNAAIEALKMAELVEKMLNFSLSALNSGRLEGIEKVNKVHEILGQFANSINAYMGLITSSDPTEEDAQRAFLIMNCVTNLAHAGDVIKRNLSRRIARKIRVGVQFDEEHLAEVAQLARIIEASLRLLVPALTVSDIDTAVELARQKDRFRATEDKLIRRYLSTQGNSSTEGSIVSIFVDVIHDLHRINSHIASSGYPVVSAAGMLKASRVANN